MKIFYLQFRVQPSVENEKYDLVEGAFAHCWIKETNPQNALVKAEYYVSKSDWKIFEIESYPIEVNESFFSGKDLGLENYIKAKLDGISIAFVGWARDGKTSNGPVELKQSFKYPISEFIDSQKRLSQMGRCLHYGNGHGCNEIIRAHSIQKNKSLSAIAHKGHVYKINSNIGSLKKNKGRLTFEKDGINKVSTFLGFCKKHDNELFEPIDNSFLIPTDQQVLLYSYRSLCRELFVSENALKLINDKLKNGINQDAIRNLFSDYSTGKSFGLENLKKHKLNFDKSLMNGSFSDIRYVIFQSRQEPIIAFSGIFYPDYDFLGRQLQDLGDQTLDLQVLTFCSAPTENGWAYLFAWHETSSKVCVSFMQSLANMIHGDIDSLNDHLFRLAMTNCENLAISPKWWENLVEENKKEIESKVALMADIFSITEPTYLMKGLEGISDWKFENVISNMD